MIFRSSVVSSKAHKEFKEGLFLMSIKLKELNSSWHKNMPVKFKHSRGNYLRKITDGHNAL